jgi:hypothetical protein
MSFGAVCLIAAAYKYGAGEWTAQQAAAFFFVSFTSFLWGYVRGRFAEAERRQQEVQK